jgi:hypothetical protein
VASGEASTLTWSSTNATTCTASSGGWSGTKATSGSQSTGALTASGNYTLTCTGAGGSASRSTTVTVAGTQPSQVPPAPPPLTQLPSWVTALQIGQWGQIPNTALSSVAPAQTPSGNTGPQSKVVAWTSFVVDTRTSKVYSVAGGGHQDYSGNEVDELTLETDQPRWTQKLEPTPNSLIRDNQSYYGDGRPTSRHSYYGVTLYVVNDRIMLFGGGMWGVVGTFHSAVSSYNIAANSYNPQGTHPSIPGSTLETAAYSVDPTTGDVYGASFSNYRRWNRATNTWTVLNPSGSGPNGAESMSAMDTSATRPHRILFVGGLGNDHHVYSLANNTFTPISLNGASAASIAGAVKGAMVYVPAFDQYLVRLGGSGATVYMIHPETFAVTELATTTAGSTTIPSTLNGPYNKFLYVPRLGGAVYVPSYTGNAWFLRLH